jgi:aconitate hydratase
MKQNLTHAILAKHLVSGSTLPEPGGEISLRVDQTLTQDATGTLAYLQYEAIVAGRTDRNVHVRRAVSYVDHNTIQPSFENSDDHRYLRTVAARYGIIFSPAGTGICHHVHLENFARPGEILIGSDSHTPTSSGIGMLAIGVGGLEIACVLAGEPLVIPMPAVVNVRLTGRLSRWVSAKDLILHLLRKHTVKGGVNRVFEYTGDGIRGLSVYDRATVTNMGTEMGLTTSIFPSDEVTRDFLIRQGRAKDYRALGPAAGCSYDESEDVRLDEVEPLVAQPHSPDRVAPVASLEGKAVDQVCIGSCTNSSLKDLIFLCRIMEGRRVSPHVSVSVNPGSRQMVLVLEKMGLLQNLYRAGIRVMEPVCGACIGQGQAPVSAGVSVRTFNRNFEGRSGTMDAKVYLASVETAAACALYGKFTHPARLGSYPRITLPRKFFVSRDEFILPPAPAKRASVEVCYGPNIAPLPRFEALEDRLDLKVAAVFGDNISTDDILPGGTRILSLRSNIPAISAFMFSRKDPGLVTRLKDFKRSGPWCLVAGENYGQGSSREHAAIVQRFHGIRVVIAKSFARIHRSNLINFGVVPMRFADPDDMQRLAVGERLCAEEVRAALAVGTLRLHVESGGSIPVIVELTPRERDILLAGGRLNYVTTSYGA